MGVLVYGVEVGGFLCGGVWFFWWFHGMGIWVGFFGGFRVEVEVVVVLGLQVGLSYGSFGEFRVEA